MDQNTKAVDPNDLPQTSGAVTAVPKNQERVTLRKYFAERKAIADKIAAEHPEEAAQIELDAVKVFPGKVKEMQQPRESYRISRLLKLAEGTNA